jgi:hypothetical protein
MKILEYNILIHIESMDSSQYLRAKQRGIQVYKSNWQPRDASEVTTRNFQRSQANNATIHHGPLPECCTGNTIRVPLPNPGRGFSTDYSASTVFQRKAGCAQCHDEVFGKPGGVVVKDCCQEPEIEIVINPAIYGAYVTNARFLQHSAVDSQGNTWLFIWSADTTLPIQVYNRYGVLVETIQSNPTYFTGAIVFISADGVSNIWANRFLITGNANLLTDQSAPVFDSQGNFITQLQVIAFNPIPTYFQIFDRNSQSYFQYSAAAGDYSRETFLLKISPTGVWSGSSDPNTWIGRVISSALSFDGNSIFIVKLDNNDNIIIQVVTINTTGSAITVRSYDKSGTAFGTAIPIQSGPSSIRHSIIVKFASNGGSTGSWNAYVYNTTAQIAFTNYLNNLQITSTNKIVFAFHYAGTGNEVRGSDNTIIGAALPFSTIGSGPTPLHTCIAVFGSDGTAANSFRVTIQPATGAKQVIPIAVLVDSSNSIYCVGTAQQGNNTEVIRPYNASDTAVSGVEFTGNLGNVFFVKFTSTGVPSWISSLRGQNSPFTQFGESDNAIVINQYINAYLDTQENLVSQIIYVSGTATYYNTTQTLIRTLATASAGSYEACIVKISPDGLTAYSARIGAVTGGTPANTFLFRMYFDAANNINVLGWYLDNPCGFFSSTDDTTPLVQVPIAASGTTNQFLAVYTPTLSSVQVARVVPTVANTAAFPYTLQQLNTNYIVIGQYNGPISIFNFGNYTTTPNETRGVQGDWDVYILNFSTISSLWAVTVAGAGLEYVGQTYNAYYFYQYSQLRIVNGMILMEIASYDAMPNVYDRSGTLVSSMMNNQTASPPYFGYQLAIPLDGYNIQPVTPTETVQPRAVSCYCADPGILQQPFPVDCSRVAPSYTGSANQVPILSNQQFGHKPKQQYPYPSG